MRWPSPVRVNMEFEWDEQEIMSEKHIVRRTVAERRPGKTNRAKLRSKSEAEIERAALEDEDNPLWTEEELQGARLVLPSGEPRVPVSIRLDREVIDYFKAQGAGYQSRIGAVLLSYVRGQQHDQMPTRRRTASAAKKTASAKKSKTTTKKTAAKRLKKEATTR